MIVAGETFTQATATADAIYDARAWAATPPTSTLYPARVGNTASAPRQGWFGGRIDGQYAETLTWQEMKADFDGAGVLVFSREWCSVDGVRVRNVMDGVRPRGESAVSRGNWSNMRVSNCWFEYIRDDAIEHDQVTGGMIRDCLADGVYVFVSTQNGTWDGAHNLHVVDCLARMEPMSYADESDGHGHPFKIVASAGVPMLIRNCVFAMSQAPRTTADWPSRARYENCVLVWTGSGTYPGWLPRRGMTVTTDGTVWDRAATDWKTRHGVTDWETVNMAQMLNPAPPPSALSFL